MMQIEKPMTKPKHGHMMSGLDRVPLLSAAVYLLWILIAAVSFLTVGVMTVVFGALQ